MVIMALLLCNQPEVDRGRRRSFRVEMKGRAQVSWQQGAQAVQTVDLMAVWVSLWLNLGEQEKELEAGGKAWPGFSCIGFSRCQPERKR